MAQLRNVETSLAGALALLWELKLAAAGCALEGMEALHASLRTGEGIVPYPVVDAPTVLPQGDRLHVGVMLRGRMPRPGGGIFEMTCDGKPIAVEEGVGKVRFSAQGPPGTKHWEAAIRVKLSHGNRDTVFRAIQTYRVLPR